MDVSEFCDAVGDDNSRSGSGGGGGRDCVGPDGALVMAVEFCNEFGDDNAWDCVGSGGGGGGPDCV